MLTALAWPGTATQSDETVDQSPSRPVPGDVAYLALGSNLGDRRQNLVAALRGLAGFLTVEAISSVYRSAAVGDDEQPEYWNLVVRVRTSLEPHDLLLRMQQVEHELGRQRPFPNAPRTIDIDLLLLGERVMHTPALDLPHPRMSRRAFVLRPLAELDPDLHHPVERRSAADLLRMLDDPNSARPVFAGAELLRDAGVAPS
jgi:2-amino-4-hydroxy-6-hydroxymethyldihydropteridine diphosphokinase